MLKNEAVQSLTQGIGTEKMTLMEEATRKTGIDAVSDAPFGTHFCLFYETKEDLIDVLVPYFKAGLESNEFCMWVTSEPLSEEEAKEAMRRVVPDFDGYVERGQIEIVPHIEWYLKGGAFNLQRVLNGWVDKLNQALAKGYDGIRVTGNTAWLEKRDWKNFVDYEQEVDDVIGKYQIIAICTYSLDKCEASDIIDVVSNHQFALIKRSGAWELIESSELKKTKERIRIAEERFLNTLNNMLEGCQIIGYDWRYLYVNDAVARHGRTTKEKLLGKTMMEMYPGIEKTEMFSKLQQCMKERIPIRMENEFTYPDGEKGWFELSIQPVPEGIFILSIDITERKKAEERIRESEERFRNLFENARDIIATFDMKGNFTSINKIIEEYGFKVDEIIGKNMLKFVSKKYWPKLLKELADIARGQPVEGEIEIITPKGKKIAEYRSNPVKLENKVVGFQTILRDITERIKMEEKLKQYSEHLEELVQKRTEELLESEKRYSVLVEEASDGVVILQDEKIVFANKKAGEIVGYSRGEAIGLPYEKLLDEEYHQQAKELYLGRLRGETIPATYELKLIAKTGERVPVEISGKLLHHQGLPAILVILRDIRERKRMEEQRLRLEKLAAIAELAAMVGHDLRNPLQSIENAVYYLNNELAFLSPSLPNSKKTMEMLRVINDSVNYADKIVRDLQDFSATKKPVLENIDINMLVKETLPQTEAPRNIEINTELSQLPEIKVDKNQMKRIFLNLITNAIQAMENGGTLTVSTKKTNGFVEISFKDTGVGISKENMEKLFTPFYTTKAKGMGMGLLICKKFVELHGGKVQVESEVGKGSVFTVKLPIQQNNGGENQ